MIWDVRLEAQFITFELVKVLTPTESRHREPLHAIPKCRLLARLLPTCMPVMLGRTMRSGRALQRSRIGLGCSF